MRSNEKRGILSGDYILLMGFRISAPHQPVLRSLGDSRLYRPSAHGHTETPQGLRLACGPPSPRQAHLLRQAMDPPHTPWCPAPGQRCPHVSVGGPTGLWGHRLAL